MADIDDPAQRRKTAYMMFDYLSQAPVLLPLAVPQPDGGATVQVPATAEAIANIMVSVDPKNGTVAMAMYLGTTSLQESFPGCRFVCQQAKDALEMFLAGRYSFLCFKLEGQWVSWTREQATEVLEAGRLGPG